MSNNPKPARAQLRPGADFARRGIPVTRQPQRLWFRRFLDQPCLALFDRGGLQSKLQVKLLGSLTNLDAAVDWLDERKAALV